MLKRLLFLAVLPLIFLVFANKGAAQQKVKHTQLIQLSGIVVDKDSLQPIPFTAILIKRSSGGAIADISGFFSFIVIPGDTVVFSALGYRVNSYAVPDTLSTDKYSLIHMMTKDTTSLKTVVFYGWPSRETFKDKFCRLDLPDNEMDRAKKNMALAARKARYTNDTRSPGANYLNTVQQETDKLYYAGQFPPNNLLNPLAWAKFIQAWKDGSLNIQ